MNININNEIKLLEVSLLDDKKKLKEISYWLKVLNRPNGWHYDLDIIWVLKELDKANILPGSTIIDAGAGQGIMQYLLAARGYNVISLDFSPRTKPRATRGIFNIIGNGNDDIDYQHPYQEFISYGLNPVMKKWQNMFKSGSIKKIPRIPKKLLSLITYRIFNSFERFLKNHQSYGAITYLRAPFHAVPLESSSVDAVISLSAIEHADISLFDKNVEELQRLLKLQAPFLLTTSATVSNGNIYDEKTSGWCYSLSSLKKYFLNYNVKFDTEQCSSGLIESELFRSRLDPYYYHDKTGFCYKKHISTLPYLPVAIKFVK